MTRLMTKRHHCAFIPSIITSHNDIANDFCDCLLSAFLDCGVPLHPYCGHLSPGESTGFNRPSAIARNYICLSYIGWTLVTPLV